MNEILDFRSDTVTKPSPAMRRAMAEAEVGDDVFGDDPTVRALEQRAAELLGKAAAVYVPSGTMGNQAAIAAHTRPGEEIVADDRSHIVLYEMGMAAQFSGCMMRAAATPDGLLRAEDVEARLRPPSDHYRGTSLVCVENTHNMAGGRVYPLDRLREIAAVARRRGVRMHMDGARVFNAAAALGVPVAEVVAEADSVSFCLSKGLGAPVGSVLAGETEFVERARLVRKGLGGGMRQAGVIAAAGLVALEETPPLLPADHANAKYIARQLGEMSGVAMETPEPETGELRERLRRRGILVTGSADRIRMLTHRDVDRAACERAVDEIHGALREG